MITRPPPQFGTADKIRIDRQWTLFGERYPDFCIVREYKFRSEGIFVTTPGATVDAERRAEAQSYHDEIIALDDAELDARWIEHQRAEAARHEAEHPLNAALATDAVYDFYSKTSYWSLEEGVSLLLERDPKGLNSESVKKYRSPPWIGRQFIALLDLARRAAKMRQLSYQGTPGFFLAWAKRNRIAVPEALERAIADHGHQVADWKTLSDQQAVRIAELTQQIEELTGARKAKLLPAPVGALGTLERSSLLKIILGMAMASYEHDPRATRTRTVSGMLQDFDTLGIAIGDDTIRKYLHEAAEFAPPPETE